jgi:hypothetical protein
MKISVGDPAHTGASHNAAALIDPAILSLISGCKVLRFVKLL